jgi:hypothetical protein
VTPSHVTGSASLGGPGPVEPHVRAAQEGQGQSRHTEWRDSPVCTGPPGPSRAIQSGTSASVQQEDINV